MVSRTLVGAFAAKPLTPLKHDMWKAGYAYLINLYSLKVCRVSIFEEGRKG